MKRLYSLVILLAISLGTSPALLLGLFQKMRQTRIENVVKGALLGEADNQYALGNFFMAENEDKWPKNETQAVYWYHKAAEQEQSKAQLKLGDCYRTGMGVRPDYPLAMYWYKKAAQNMNEEAINKFQELEKLGYKEAIDDVFNYNELYIEEFYKEYADSIRTINKEEEIRRKKIEKNLKQSQERYVDLLINNTPSKYEENVSVWAEARKAELEAEQKYKLNPLNYEETMLDLEKTQIEVRLQQLREEREAYDKLCSEEAKNSSPFFAIDGYDPPMLTLTGDSVVFVSSTNNGFIQAGEKSFLKFVIQNKGKGVATNCETKIKMSGVTNGILVENINLPNIPAGQTYTVKIPVVTDINTEDGKVMFTIEVYEPHGNGVAPFDYTLTTKAFKAPLLQVTDYKIISNSDKIHKMESFKVSFSIQNVQIGEAEDVRVKVEIPDNVLVMDGNTELVYPKIKSGETKIAIITLATNNYYARTNIPVVINIKEKHGRFSENRNINIELSDEAYSIGEKTIRINMKSRIEILLNTSVSILRPVWFNKYNTPQNVKSPFPYAAIKLELNGDKEAIEIAKECLSLTMGGKHIVEAKDSKETNTIWFLVHCRNEYIDMDCGDGCKPINIWKERLEPNKVYKGCISISVQ